MTRQQIDERYWTTEIPRCRFCGTNRHARLWRGLCLRCYPLIHKIETIDRGLYRRRGRHSNSRPSANDYIRTCARKELGNLKQLEAPLLAQASGDDIEGLLVTISRVLGAGQFVVDSVRYDFDACVKPENMNRIYKVLLRIVENIPSKRVRKPYLGYPDYLRRLRSLDEDTLLLQQFTK